MTDVQDAYEDLQTNDRVVQLYLSGYLDVARRTATSANTHTSAARLACSIF